MSFIIQLVSREDKSWIVGTKKEKLLWIVSTLLEVYDLNIVEIIILYMSTSFQ